MTTQVLEESKLVADELLNPHGDFQNQGFEQILSAVKSRLEYAYLRGYQRANLDKPVPENALIFDLKYQIELLRNELRVKSAILNQSEARIVELETKTKAPQ